VAQLRRDRLTWLIYLQLGVYGYFLYGFGPTVPLLRDEQDISRTLSGLHGTALAVGALVAGTTTAAIVRRWGRATALWGGLAVLCLGVVAYVSTTALPLTLTGAFLGSLGGSFTITAVAPTLMEHHGAAGPAAISEANATAAAAGIVAPLLVGLAVLTGVGWRAGVLFVLVLVAALVVALGRTPIPPAHEVPDYHAGSTRLPTRYWIGWGVLTACIATEFCLTLWAADILRSRDGLGPGAASASLTGLVTGMFAGRLVGGRLALRFGVDQMLYAALAVAAAGFAVFWAATWAPLAIAGLLICGLGVALHYPLGIARAIDAAEGRPDLASARASLGAALAVGAGPFALGALADQIGLHKAFLVVPGLLVLAAVGVRIGGRSRFAAPAVSA
jgi:predicted MFS family arabinose efflux permease